MQWAGNDRETTEAAPTTAPSPIVTPGSTTTRAPSHTSEPITTSASRFGWSITGVPWARP